MNDLHAPLKALRSAGTDPKTETRFAELMAQAKGRAEAFLWPAPPFSGYPAAAEQTQPEACAIEGLNGKIVQGRLIFFVPDESVANVQMPPARTTLPLQFSQFRSLRLTDPLSPSDAGSSELADRPRSPYLVHLKDGSRLEGESIGHQYLPFGLFLFPPEGRGDAVTRLFVPREAILSSRVGDGDGFDAGPATISGPETLSGDLAELSPVGNPVATAPPTEPERSAAPAVISQQSANPEQLLEAIRMQSRMPMVRMGEALISLGLITDAQLEEALEFQKTDRSVPIGELLVRTGKVSRQDLRTALARKMGYPSVNVDQFPVSAEALRKLPHPVAERLRALPLMLRGTTLVVALEDPSGRSTLEEIEFASSCKVAPVLAQAGDVAAAVKTAYARIGIETAAAEEAAQEATGTDKLLESLEREDSDQPRRDGEKAIEQSDNSLVRLIHTMIIEAHNDGTSDIHIENYPGRDKLKIRFRKDGVLRPYLELPHTYRNAVIGRIKIMCDLDISERRKPQDGKINFAKFSPSHRIELRVATIPTNNGLEDVVMRLLTSAKPVPLGNLGFSPRHLTQLKTAIERPYGLVLCVGPTGSGKTTTLHSALSHINVPERKIWTAEDPVEITQPGLRQVQVNPKIDWTFAKALRAFLRADPDVIMIGEIRDAETGRMAVEASLTGHLVMSTLHTNSAPDTVTRLLDMGLDPFNFADSLLLVVAQRLVRKRCVQCREPRPMSDAELDELMDDYLFNQPQSDSGAARQQLRGEWLGRFGVNGRLMHFSNAGCPACDQSGFRGRCGLHELMPISRDLRRMIQTGARAEDLQTTALTQGMLTLRQDGIEKVLQGLTTIDEVRATSNS
jgi:type II secretory ATPase GspE/PulE/Tfp pilus assembly ATPase PilB-like protein